MQPRHLEPVKGALVLVAVFAGLAWLLSSAPPAVHAQVPGVAATRSCQFTAAQQVCTIDLTGAGAAAVQLEGTWVGTVAFEATINGTMVAINMVPSNTTTPATSATTTGAWNANVGGYRVFQVRASAYTSGTVVATVSISSSGGK